MHILLLSYYRKIVEEKYQENHLRMQEYKSNFQKVNVDVLKVYRIPI